MAIGFEEKQPQPKDDMRAYSVPEIANILRISRAKAYELCKEGHFSTVRIGSAVRVSRKSFDDWLDGINK